MRMKLSRRQKNGICLYLLSLRRTSRLSLTKLWRTWSAFITHPWLCSGRGATPTAFSAKQGWFIPVRNHITFWCISMKTESRTSMSCGLRSTRRKKRPTPSLYSGKLLNREMQTLRTSLENATQAAAALNRAMKRQPDTTVWPRIRDLQRVSTIWRISTCTDWVWSGTVPKQMPCSSLRRSRA